jgi:hypothetical protein
MKRRPKFEGQDVVAIDCRVTGAVGDGRLNEALPPGRRVVVVSEGILRRVAHLNTAEGVVRVQTIQVAEGFVLEDETDAADLVHKLRADRKRELDELLGTPPLDGFPEGEA